jgi:hypothetical protein
MVVLSKNIMIKKRILLCPAPGFFRMIAVIFLCITFFTSSAFATGYILNATSIGQYGNGIRYTGSEDLIIEIGDDVTIASDSNAGIQSAAPVTIRSPTGRTLTIQVSNNSDKLYGIKAPSVSLVSGRLDITVYGENDPEAGNAFGICAESDNVTIAGGSVFTDIGTTGHKNKGIYAQRYIIISDGQIDAWEHGGFNTFGLDGGDVDVGDSTGGVIISGGHIAINSTGGTVRNFGIDSKFGTVTITGNPVIFIYEDESGSRDNFAYRSNITTVSGGNAVIFASEGGNYTLQNDTVLTQNATLIPRKVFEIPLGRTLGISERTYLTKPADTTLLFGGSYGTFAYVRSSPDTGGAVVYAGGETTQKAPVPVTLLLAGLGVAVLLVRRK